MDGVGEFDNYWSDIGISEAVEMLAKFTAIDWDELHRAIPQKSQIWLVSCCETLSEASDGEQAHKVLLEITKLGDPIVENAANSAIREVLPRLSGK